MNGRFLGDWREGDVLESLVFPVTSTAIVASALATRDYSPLHHDDRYVREQAGLPGILLNSPAIQALVGRYLGERFGTLARPGRLRIALQAAVHAGVSLSLTGRITGLAIDARGVGWANVAVELRDAERCCVQVSARLAIPVDAHDDPWRRTGEDWQP